MTAQRPDKLDYQGKLLSLFTDPLESLSRDRRPGFVSDNTGDWRGYVALWEIRDGRLYLKDLRGRMCTVPPESGARQAKCGKHHKPLCEIKSVEIREAFPAESGPIFANWYTGTLKVPQGRLLQYVHMGYASQYECYLMIDIAAGTVVQTREVKADPPPAPKSPTPLHSIALWFKSYARAIRSRW